ncbi:MAG: hypothetical protein ACRDG3_05875 [Tepidiformaceae bacterium]
MRRPPLPTPGIATLALLGLVAVPLIILAVLRLGSSDTLAGVTFDTKPMLASGTAREVVDSKPVTLALTWEKGAELTAPAWSGTVTGVSAKPGTPLKTGDIVATVDGVERVAFASDPPFYRPISSGMRGPDVVALHQMLVALGLMDAEPANPDLANFATTQAIRAFETQIGIADPGGTFDPAWIVWLPASPFPLGSLDLAVGHPAPPPGTAIGAAVPLLLQAVATSNDPAGLSLDPAVAWVLAIGDATFHLDSGTTSVAKDDLAALAAVLKPNAETASGVVQRAQALHAVAIPSTAVMSGAEGQLCVWLPAGGGYTARPVTLSGAQAGVTNVATGLDAGEQILVNPGDALKQPQCPSN